MLGAFFLNLFEFVSILFVKFMNKAFEIKHERGKDKQVNHKKNDLTYAIKKPLAQQCQINFKIDI